MVPVNNRDYLRWLCQKSLCDCRANLLKTGMNMKELTAQKGALVKEDLQVLQRFQGLEPGGYLCSEIQEYSCRPTDRTVVHGTIDGGSSPPGSTMTDA